MESYIVHSYVKETKMGVKNERLLKRAYVSMVLDG